jgi:exodeoxyribonuclease III
MRCILNKKWVSWNVNGIRSVMKKDFMNWLQSTDADLVCLQEVRALEEQVPSELVEKLKDMGYQSFWSAAEKKGYSGVASFTKVKPVAVHSKFGVEEFDLEGRLQGIEFEDTIVFNGYFPNGGASAERLAYKMRFYAWFKELCQEWSDKGKHVVVCGDLNTCHTEIDIARPKANKKKSGFLMEERDWMTEFLAGGFADAFRQLYPTKLDVYSWWSNRGGARERNVGWRIDYWFISNSLKESLVEAEVNTLDLGSDHCPITLYLN